MAATESFTKTNTPSAKDPEDWPVYNLARSVRAIKLTDKFKYAGETFDGGYLVFDAGEVKAVGLEEFERHAVYQG